MLSTNTGRNQYFNAIAVFASLIFGAAIGFLYGTGNVPNIATSVWITFGLGALSLIFEFIDVDLASLHPQTSLNKCLHCELNALLAGTIGTIAASLALLSVTLTPTSIWVNILVATDAFFFALMIIEWIILLNCIVNRRARED